MRARAEEKPSTKIRLSKTRLEEVLKRHNGVYKAAAVELGISYSHLKQIRRVFGMKTIKTRAFGEPAPFDWALFWYLDRLNNSELYEEEIDF
ncbi:MAG: hypothetical protein C5B49_01930 [Bdellovibrio sp.]|nr:MAG: hypothetical protein C5B49_01930 [Bdellovibrio sp.]